MTQRMDAAHLGDAGGGASCVVVKLATAAVQRLRSIAATRKQPVICFGTDSCGAPVQSQLFEQVGGEQAEAVLAALALDDPDAHAVGSGVDVAPAQMTQLTQAQTASKGHPEHVFKADFPDCF